MSRHGVRTPTVSAQELSTWAAEPWPTWKEPAGNLTARGRALAVLLGRYHREALAAEGLLPARGCPAPESVFIYADVIQRTLETADGLAEGLAPGCGLSVRSLAPATVDGVFHPLTASVCRLDPLRAQTSVLERVGGNLTAAVARKQEALRTLQSALKCCAPGLCAAFGKSKGCTLTDIPAALTTPAGGNELDLAGSLWIASAASEIFLLEYTEGKPKAEVGWGRVDLPQIREALALHDLAFDLTERTDYLARRHGSALLARAAAALTGEAFAGGGAAVDAARAASFAAFVGHDTNIANLGGMLGVTWTMPGYQPDETPPGGALLFELREDAGGKRRVFLSYLSQSPDQMRHAVPLTLAAPPLRTPIRMPTCSTDEPGYPCAVDAFAKMVRAALDPECVGPRG